MTPQDFVARAAAIDAFDEALTEAGRNVGSVRLSSSREARVVRLRQGEPSISTGPFQTTPEQIGGIYLVEANHLGGASEIAERLVRAGIGSVEVRPILGIDLRATVAHDPGV